MSGLRPRGLGPSAAVAPVASRRPAGTDPRRRLTALPTAFLSAVAAGAAFHRVYEFRSLLPLVVMAAAAPVVLSGLLSVRRDGTRAPLWRTVVAGPVAWLLCAWGLLYRRESLTPGLVRRMGGDLLDAPHRVLTMITPLPGEGALLILPFTAVWLAAAAGAELALRTETVLFPALPGAAVFGVAVVLGAGEPGTTVPVAAGFVVAVGLLVVLRAPRVHTSRPRARRAVVAAVPLIAAQALVAAVVAPVATGVDGRSPVSPRADAAAREPAYVNGGNPLDLVGSWLLDPARPLFLVRATELTDQDWRLTVLTDFDGSTWSPPDLLRPTGGRVPGRAAGTPEAGVRPVALDQRITVQQLGGVWLPSVGRPVRVTGPVAERLVVDPDTGALADTAPIREGDSYRVASRVPVFDARLVQYAPTAVDPAMTRLPDSPTRDLLRELGQRATQGSTFPYQQALRLAAWLREGHVFDVQAAPGHTYRSLEFFLTESKRGTSEQFAAAFAVMARSLGLPTRLVVGFHHGTATPDGWQVTGRDAVVWPEVEFAGVGWVPFQPTPGQRVTAAPAGPAAVPTGPEETAAAPGAGAQRLLDDARIIDAPHQGAGVPGAGGGGGGGPRWLWVLAAVGGAGCAAVSGWAGWRALRPWRVRRAERRGSPAAQVVAAWRRIGASLHGAGMAAPGTLTVEEVAAFWDGYAGECGDRSVADLAVLVNAVGYAGLEPDEAAAAEAWRTAARVADAVAAGARAPA